MMSLHKLTAGDGYEYLTKQVAAHDNTELGKDSLESYYSAKGEAPGRWLGSGLVAFDDINAGDVVTSEQMKALWGEGRHPNATAIEAAMSADGHGAGVALAATRLGTPFKVYDGANDFVTAVAEAFSEHNTSRGEKARAEIPADVRAQIRTRVATDMFTTEFGRSPADSRELSGWIARKTRQKTTAVAGYDLTFSPVKSVSTLWAVAPREVAQRIEAAHQRAVEKTLASIERDVAYTRIGTNGVARVEADGLIAAAFTHRDSRCGDPDLHTHVPISNKVRYTGVDGIQRWGALDGKPLHRLAVQASEEYNSRLEAEIIAEFPGIHFADRDPELRGKRPVREIVGVSPELSARWSARTRSIQDKTDELIARFQAEHGREPTAVEHIALRQQANLATREAKHEPRSLAEQRTQWRAEAIDTLGSDAALADLVSTSLGVSVHPELAAEMRRLEGMFTLGRAHPHHPPAPTGDRLWELAAANLADHGPRRPEDLTDAQVRDYAHTAVTRVATTRSVWQPHHVRAEALRQARILGVAPEHITAVADRIAATALSEHCVHITRARRDGDRGEPAMLRGSDGESVFVDRSLDHFTSPEVLAAERRIVAAAQLSDGHRSDPMHVDLALLEHEANKYPLNAGQQALVREFATTGARFHLALAPAGTGKTSAMAAFTTAWTNGGGTLIGLAPTANAAQVLAKDIGSHADTLDKYAWTLHALRAAGDDPDARAAVLEKAPDWFEKIGPGTVVLIDEIGMSSTASLDPVIADALARGADVKGVGDDQQLASVAAGGVLRDVADVGNTLTLTEVMRFTDTAEGAASLAIREGREEAIGYYIDHQRVHVTADTLAADIAYQAWRRDTQAGHASVMLAPTLDTVRELNERARNDRLADYPALAGGREVTLADGLTASLGDTIRTRRNDRRLRLSGTDFVRNGYRWTITDVGADNTLTVRHETSGASLTLPADYVRSDCELGYASTIHGAQGMTVGSRGKQLGTCHIVGSDQLDKQLLYVAMTRGTDGNHLYLGTSESDPHKIIFDRAQRPPTAVDLMRSILTRDGAQTSATTAVRDADSPAARLAAAADNYTFAVGAISEHHLGPEVMAAIDHGADHHLPGLTDAAAWPVLRHHLATLAVDRPNPDTAAADYTLERLAAAIAVRELGTAADPAAVLDWRLDHSGEHSAARRGPLPWLPAIPAALAAHDDYGPYLARREQLATDMAGHVRANAETWTAASAPRWARPLVVADGDHGRLLADIAVFRAAHTIDDRDKRPLGPDQYALSRRRHQDRLAERFADAIHTDGADTRRWDQLAHSIDTHLTADPFWPDLAERLSVAARAGVDVHTLLTDAAADTTLPTELPAAALWWRVAGDLEPAVLDATDSAIRVPWTSELAHIVGDQAAEAIYTDPAWPSLVAAVTAADPQQWTPAEILATADQLLHAGGDGEHVRLDEYARALAWRVDLLATHSAHAEDIPLPDEPLSTAEEETAPADPTIEHTSEPADLHDQGHGDLPETATDADDDYLAALTADPAPSGDEEEYGPQVDDLGDLDFDDLTADRPAIVVELPEDTDLDELRRAAAAAHADTNRLHALILDPTQQGPAVAAARGRLDELQHRADAHRPALAEMTRAHHDWVEADLAAEAAAAVRDRLTPTTGDDDPRLAAERELAAVHAEDARARADEALVRVSAANSTLTKLAPNGVVTAGDVHRARMAAERVDLDALTRLRGAAHRLDDRVFRAERSAARRRAASLTLPPPMPTAPARTTRTDVRRHSPVELAASVGTVALADAPLDELAIAYHTATADLAEHRIRAAAQVFGPTAADALARDPRRVALADALAAAHRHGIAPDDALRSAARSVDLTPDAAGLATHVHQLATTTADTHYRHWKTDHSEQLERAFPAADTTSSDWDTFCRRLFHQHQTTGADIRTLYGQITQHAPALADAVTLDTAAAHAFTTPVTTPDWAPAPVAIPGDNAAALDVAQQAHRDYTSALSARTAGPTIDTANAASRWEPILGTRPTDPRLADTWDSAHTHLDAYHAQYGSASTTFDPVPESAPHHQRTAHASVTNHIDDLTSQQREQHLQRLADLDQQRNSARLGTDNDAAAHRSAPQEIEHTRRRL
ncbi:relaxase domain-containing protein [Gordonia sp. SID5947]|uniref:MobF family relaxase n=1 Tax=Gordonia sp. SID5947 TaxID=2690315 RepID=UPI001371E60E|nr:MobF family relaxase [Gordonia sp. SID5947]MYR08981.1 relaxase domain-containing protein [Gordonia sp. SID5947]